MRRASACSSGFSMKPFSCSCFKREESDSPQSTRSKEAKQVRVSGAGWEEALLFQEVGEGL